MNITEFLDARIAEDEAVAARALGRDDIGSTIWCAENDGAITEVEAEVEAGFVRRFHPTRVLAECAAKQAILEAHQPTVETVEWFDDVTGIGTAPVCPSCRPKDPTDWNPPIGMAGIRPDGFIPSYVLAPCPTLRAIAAVHKDHPDYQEEWAHGND